MNYPAGTGTGLEKNGRISGQPEPEPDIRYIPNQNIENNKNIMIFSNLYFRSDIANIFKTFYLCIILKHNFRQRISS